MPRTSVLFSCYRLQTSHLYCWAHHSPYQRMHMSVNRHRHTQYYQSRTTRDIVLGCILCTGLRLVLSRYFEGHLLAKGLRSTVQLDALAAALDTRIAGARFYLALHQHRETGGRYYARERERLHSAQIDSEAYAQLLHSAERP